MLPKRGDWMPKVSVPRAKTRREKCVLLTSSSIEVFADHGPGEAPIY